MEFHNNKKKRINVVNDAMEYDGEMQLMHSIRNDIVTFLTWCLSFETGWSSSGVSVSTDDSGWGDITLITYLFSEWHYLFSHFFKHFVQEKLCCHENGDQKDHEKTNPCCSTIIHSGEDFHVPEMPQLSSQQLFVCFLGLFGEISVSVCQKATRCHNINKNYEWKLDFTLT